MAKFVCTGWRKVTGLPLFLSFFAIASGKLERRYHDINEGVYWCRWSSSMSWWSAAAALACVPRSLRRKAIRVFASRSISKVVPMRSHTVAAEGGAAAVVRPDDSLDSHFDDTVSGGDWLCDQDCRRVFRRSLRPGDDPARALGLPVEPQGRRQHQRAVLRRHEGPAHLVRRRSQRLSHPAHAVPDIAQISVDQALRRVLLRRADRGGWRASGACSRSRSPPASSSCSRARRWSYAPAARGAYSARTPMQEPSPATAWRSRIATACRCATWSSCSGIRRRCPEPAS